MRVSPEDERAAGVKRVVVAFKRDWPPYRRGDVAGLEALEASQLLSLGVIKRHREGDKVPKPRDHRVMIGSNSTRTGAL